MQLVKNLVNAGDARDVGSTPGVRKTSWSRKWQLTPILLPGKFHTQRYLAGYSPWGREDSDITKHTQTHTHTHTHDSAILLLGIYPEKATLLKDRYDAYCSTIYNSARKNLDVHLQMSG